MNQSIWRTIPKIHGITDFDILETCLQVISSSNKGAVREGICVHSPITKLRMQDDLYLNNNLLSLYAKCFSIKLARQFFDEMPERDVVSWTGIMSAYNKNNCYKETLDLFDLMLVSGELPNEFTLSSVLRSCSAVEEFELGKEVQAYLMRHGFDHSSPIFGSLLVDLYTKDNCPEKAYTIFRSMKRQDTVSWTIMVSSLIHAASWRRALQLYPCMINARVLPNEFSFVKFLAACSHLGLSYGRLVHAHLIIWGVDLNLVVKTALVDMYLKCESVDEAIRASKQTPVYDVCLWATIISGFSLNSRFEDAISAFYEMVACGMSPNNFVFTGVLSACSSIRSLDLGKQLHTQVIMSGWGSDVSVDNALLDMYRKCSDIIEDAVVFFKGIKLPNVISWTSLISGFAEHGFYEQAFHAFWEMQFSDIRPNSFTLSAILTVCNATRCPTKTRKFHGYMIKSYTEHDIVVGNALVDVYAGLGMVEDARHLVGNMDHNDVITFTCLATRLNEMNCQEMALSVVNKMFEKGVKMDGFSMSSFLSASASLTMSITGKQLHGYCIKSDLCSWNSVLNSLIHFYGKCGFLSDARRVFDKMHDPDVVSWNGLIAGLASNGYISTSLSAFENMRLSGIEPDAVTFLLVLSSCSHGGLADLGMEYFELMKKHALEPQLDHYSCLVDILGRTGRLEEALDVIRIMPFTPDSLIYKTLLSACKLHGNIFLGEDMARKALELNPMDPALYLLVVSMYDDLGRSDLAGQTRKLMRDRGLEKVPGQSWVEERDKIHIFTGGDKSHPDIKKIHEKLASMTAELKNQRPDYRINEDSFYHSERLAVAFCLMHIPMPSAIRVFNNFRICKDCHEFMNAVSQLSEREILVRDRNRFHSFKHGSCSCNDYW